MPATKFVLFDSIEGGTVAVNVDNVTYVRERIDGNGVFISFLGDDGVGVPGTVAEVAAKLSAGPDRITRDNIA